MYLSTFLSRFQNGVNFTNPLRKAQKCHQHKEFVNQTAPNFTRKYNRKLHSTFMLCVSEISINLRSGAKSACRMLMKLFHGFLLCTQYDCENYAYKFISCFSNVLDNILKDLYDTQVGNHCFRLSLQANLLQH